MFKKHIKTITLKKILEGSIYSLVFLLPLQTRYFIYEKNLGGIFWEYGSLSIYVFDIVLFFAFFLSLYLFIKNKKEIKMDKIWYFLGIFEVFVFISIFFSSSWQLSLFGYLKVLLGFILFYLIAFEKYNLNKLYISFFSGVFFQAILGMIQRLIKFSPGNKYLGIAEHDPASLGTFVVELENNSRLLRSYGGLEHPNIYGAFIFFGIFYLIKFILTNYKKNRYSKRYFNLLLLLIIFTVSLVFSFSRTAYILFIFLLAFLLVWSFFDKNRRANTQKILFVLVFSFSITILFNFAYFLERINSDSRLEHISNSERIDQTSQAIDILEENYLLGVGINNYTNYLSEKDQTIRESWNYQPVHNVYLLVASEIGLLGLLSLLMIFIYLVYILFGSKLYFEVFLVFLIMISFLFDHWFWSLHFGVVFLFFLLGLIYRRQLACKI